MGVGRIVGLAGLVTSVAIVVAERAEIRRYLLLKRAGTDPSAVGQSVTPAGNELALARKRR
ncbi:MAG: hypothetical protein ACJ72N_23930 [Labedaea sp.]